MLAAEGTLTSIRRSEVIGTLADLPTRREARALFESRLHDLNHALQKPKSSMLFREFVCSQWEPAREASSSSGRTGFLPQHVSRPGSVRPRRPGCRTAQSESAPFSSWTPNIPSSYGAVVQQLAVSTASPRRITRERVTSYRNHWRWTELALQVFIISSLFCFAIVER